MKNGFALLSVGLLIFSLFLFGCLHQGGQTSTASQTSGQAQVDTSTTDAGAQDVATDAQDVNDLTVNESELDVQ